MNEKVEKLYGDVAERLKNQKDTPSINELKGLVKYIAESYTQFPINGEKVEFDDKDIEYVADKLMEKYDIKMDMGILFEDNQPEPWLHKKQGSIEWFYWQRYENYLRTDKQYPQNVVNTLDRQTDLLLDRIKDPKSEGSWNKRGLVVGHVQSGKTSNYTGLICKAADAGYQVIIILAGLLNSLRNQTQERLDYDFMGWCTEEKKYVGCSSYNHSRKPITLTTSQKDFRKSDAEKSIHVGGLKEPVVLVLKKNKSSLESLHDWLESQNKTDLKNYSMLMIDDEADHASVNTNKEDKDPTAINTAIRNLLKLFPRCSYIGYTATPFANIFIDPKNENEMRDGELYGDLFPKDFILSLDAPTNYIGPDIVFNENNEIAITREIDDFHDILPLKHPKDLQVLELPNSLHEAINAFIISKAIRLSRGSIGKHYSMIINASWRKSIMKQIVGLTNERVKRIRSAINNYSSLPIDQALKNSYIREIHKTWKKEYSNCGINWEELQKNLKESADTIETLGIYSGGDSLEYSKRNYPEGRTVIAVGGHSLSRGLTLEGLTVSYFLRNSLMYDTLMQMGRWFGYRDGYSDLCRVYMPSEAISWYAHIADATNELRRDLESMGRARPIDFGLRVRSHPAALIVTARNKMRSARDVPVSISLEGRLAETSVVCSNADLINKNIATLEKVIIEASKETNSEKTRLGILWRNVSQRIIVNAIKAFHNHPECILTSEEPLLEYLDILKNEGLDQCDILLRSTVGEDNPKSLAGLHINKPTRTVAAYDESKIEFTRRRVASRGDEKAGIDPLEIMKITEKYKAEGREVPDRFYRIHREQNNMPPLFIINFVDACYKSNKSEKKTEVGCFSLSFPGDSGAAKRRHRSVEYRVNTVWWEQHYAMEQSDEEQDELYE